MIKEEFWKVKKNLLLPCDRRYRSFELGIKYCNEKVENLEKENQRAKQGCYKWFMRWRKVKREELEQIADIKANCDLAIEGRDIKIKELEQENTDQKDQLTKAIKIIKEMLNVLPKENIEGFYEITEEAEQFLQEIEK